MGASAIPLQVGAGVTPIQSPMQTATQGLDLSKLAGAVAIQKQMQQENQLKIQAAQEDQNDQKSIQDAFHDQSNWSVNAKGQNSPDFEKIRQAVAPKVRLRNLQALDADHLKMQQAATALTKDQIANSNAQNTAVGQAIASMLEAPPEQRQALHDAALPRLQAMGVDTSKFPTTALDDSTLKQYAAMVGYTGTLLTNAQKKAQEEEKVAQTARAAALARRADAQSQGIQDQQDREEAARSHLAIGTLPPEEQQAAHDEWMSNLSPNIAGQYKNLKKYTPEAAAAVQGMAMTSQQRAAQVTKDQNAQSAAERAAAAGGKAGLAAKATDPTATDEDKQAARDALALLEKNESKQTANSIALQHRFDQREDDKKTADAEKDSEKHTKLREQEVDQTLLGKRLISAIGDAAKSGKNTVVDPKTGKEISLADAQAQFDAAKEKAATLWDQQAELRKQHQWGEHAAGEAGPVANPWRQQQPAATPAPQGGGRGAAPVQPGAAQPPKNAKIRTDIPAAITSGIGEGQTRKVNSPSGPITLQKVNGKIYQVP